MPALGCLVGVVADPRKCTDEVQHSSRRARGTTTWRSRPLNNSLVKLRATGSRGSARRRLPRSPHNQFVTPGPAGGTITTKCLLALDSAGCYLVRASFAKDVA